MKRFEKFLFLVIILFVAVICLTACEDSKYSESYNSNNLSTSSKPVSSISLNSKIEDSQFNDNLKRKQVIEGKMRDFSNKISSGKSLSKSEMKEYAELGAELRKIISVNALYKVQKWEKNPNWVDPETGKSKAQSDKELKEESDKRIEDSTKKLKDLEKEQEADRKKLQEEYDKKVKDINKEYGY